MRPLKATPESIFVSYRRSHYEQALELQALLRTRCENVHLIDPGALALPNEVRTAFGYVELIAQLEPVILGADAFVALDTPGYLHSWWTGTEVNIWSTRYRHIALFGLDERGDLYFKRMQKVGMIFFERWFLKYRVSVVRSPNARAIAGPLADRCLVVPCPGCQQLLLVTAAWLARLSMTLTCPTCSTSVEIRQDDDRFVLDVPLGPFTADASQSMIALMRGGSAHHLERRPDGHEYVLIHYHRQALPIFRLPHEEVGAIA